MKANLHDDSVSSVSAALRMWLGRQLAPAASSWLDERRERLAQAFDQRTFFITLGMAPRRLGKADLSFDANDLALAQRLRRGWRPLGWSVSDAARVLILIETAQRFETRNEPFAALFAELCRTADVGELVAYYRGLPLYPRAVELEAQAAEGLRSNMRSVFEAIAHHSPYAREVLATGRWNQMVLKALFVGSSLAPVQGLDERANADLAQMLCDYAGERRAAGRSVPAELWRCVGPFANETMLAALARELEHGDTLQRAAAGLALTAAAAPGAVRLLDTVPELRAQIERGEVDWQGVASGATLLP